MESKQLVVMILLGVFIRQFLVHGGLRDESTLQNSAIFCGNSFFTILIKQFLVLSVWGVKGFSIIDIFVSKGGFLKGTGNRFLLIKDEFLSSDIDKVVFVYVF